MKKNISQREAKRLRRRVSELERMISDARNGYRSDYPGVEICRENVTVRTATAVDTARRLEYAVVAVLSGEYELRFYAAKQPKVYS